MSDWIKMRGALLNNAKVIKMARLLLQDPEFLTWFALDGGTIDASRTVTLRHVTVVTRVTVGGLLPVWASVNADAERHDDRHALLRDASLFEIDQIAGIPGFGKAMEAVGWLYQEPNGDGLEFSNFTEHNTVGKERSTGAKTTAERAKEYRERKKAERHETVTETVTDRHVTKRDASRDTVTTEKNREEENTSPSLRSGEGATSPRTPRPKKEETTLATYLATCRDAGKKPLPADHPVRSYCRDAGISDEMLQVAWCVFRDDYTTGTSKGKRYKDWPGHFANAVRGCWAKLWYTDATAGCVAWTSRGLQEKAVLDARARAKETEAA